MKSILKFTFWISLSLATFFGMLWLTKRLHNYQFPNYPEPIKTDFWIDPLEILIGVIGMSIVFLGLSICLRIIIKKFLKH